METLKYTTIKDKEQYYNYCNILEALVNEANLENQDEIDLLTLLIEKWDSDNTTIIDTDPIEILKYLMAEHDLKSKDLSGILGLTKSTISKILNYNKGLSKETIRKLSDYFKVSQETFNRPYRLAEANKHLPYKGISKINTAKQTHNEALSK